MSDVTFPTVHEGNGTQLDEKLISIGHTNCLEQAKIGERLIHLKDEGYEIVVKNHTLFLRGGKTRGIIN